jgi:hypothetical protein
VIAETALQILQIDQDIASEVAKELREGLIASCASICNRNSIMTGVRSLRIAPEH